MTPLLKNVFSNFRRTAQWYRNSDRRFMWQNIYPAIGDQARGFDRKLRVLDIGYAWYNSVNRSLFGSDNIEYTVVDPTRHQDANYVCDQFIQSTVGELPEVRPDLRAYFDVVISFGVLGYYSWPPAQVDAYLQAVYELSATDGSIFVKLDVRRISRWAADERVDAASLLHYFEPWKKSRRVGWGRYDFQFLKKRRAISGNHPPAGLNHQK